MAYVAVSHVGKPAPPGASVVEKVFASGTFPAFGLGDTPEEAANSLRTGLAIQGTLEGLVFTPWPPRIFSEVESPGR